MLVQSVMDTNRSIKTEYANPVKSAALSRQWQIVDVITLAFGTDPVARWAYPNSQQYLQYFSNFVRLFGGKAFEMGSAFYVGDFAAASLWLPPGVSPDEQGLISLFEATVADEIRNDLYGVFEEMAAFRPAEPHWYLPLIGTDPARQGRGLGSALLRHAVTLCESEGRPAYLESTNPKNIPLYQRFGFDVIGEVRVGSAPPVFPMLRRPRKGFNEQGSKFIQNN